MSSAQMLVSPKKVTKIKRNFICCDIVLKIENEKDILFVVIFHFIRCDIILEIKDKGIFYPL